MQSIKGTLTGTSKNQFCILIEPANAKIGTLRPLRLSFLTARDAEGLRKGRKERNAFTYQHSQSP